MPRDPLFAPAVAELRRTLAAAPQGLPANLLLVSTTDSTNSLARRIVARLVDEDEEVSEFAVIALHQSGGRGRGGRNWWSPNGAGVYATWVVTLPAEQVGWLPLRIPLAICEALNRYLGGRCQIKWPNDLLVAGRKIGGVLIEAVRRSSGQVEAVIGFGVNHSHESAGLAGLWATCLQNEVDAGAVPALGDTILTLLGAVSSALAVPLADEKLVAEFRSHLVHVAGETLHLRIGDEKLEGRFVDVDESGFLLLDVGGETRRVAAGEIVQ